MMPPTCQLRHLRMAVTRMSAGAFALAAALLCAVPGIAAPADHENFFRGKQLRLVVPTDVGVTSDTSARAGAQVLRHHIPGNPAVIVQNMPGASGLKTANFMQANAPRDGTVIASTHASILTSQLTSPGAAQFEATKFSWVGSVTTDPFIGYVWHTVPIQTLDDTRTTEVI